MTLKAYFWKPWSESDTGLCIIAETNKEAKKIGWDVWNKDYYTGEPYTDCRCKLHSNRKEADISGLPKGAVEGGIDGFKRKLYSSVEDVCEKCGYSRELAEINTEGLAICHDCVDKESEEK